MALVVSNYLKRKGSSTQRANFLAASAGDWTVAFRIASCGLQLDDESVRVAAVLRLGLNICVPHVCRCGALVDARGLHSCICKRAPGRTSRHHALNDMVVRTYASAGVLVVKERNGLKRVNGKRSDDLTP